jgi:hypothetical protein
MEACTDDWYYLSNATVRFDPATDQRFEKMDSLQFTALDSITITCKILLNNVNLMGVISDGNEARLKLQKINFCKDFWIKGSTIELRSIEHCSFQKFGIVSSIITNEINGKFLIKQCLFNDGLVLASLSLKSNVRIRESELLGESQLVMLKDGDNEIFLHVYKSKVDRIKYTHNEISNITFSYNNVRSNVSFYKNKLEKLDVGHNVFAPQKIDSSNRAAYLFSSSIGTIERFLWYNNSYDFALKERYTPCFYLGSCKVSHKLSMSSTNFPGPIVIEDVNATGSFNFGSDCTFKEGVFLKDLFFNERSNINWSALEKNIMLHSFESGRQYPSFLDSIQDYGLLERELGIEEFCEEQIKNKRIFQSVFRAQGSSRKANAVMVEIKDLETAMWEHAFLEDKTLNSYFNWKMNTFLKRFSAYGTNPVIAIIYSIKVILIFALFYLFLHNDWDLNSRKKVGKRLAFMLKYLQVDKGLSELDREEQKDAKDSLNQLHTNNERSEGKVPVFLRKAIRWYVKSNLLSNKIRDFALRKMDILSGTYSALSKAKRTKVAFLSSLWLLIFLAYTLLVKVLNALTLSLNAFTTLGFGNIPTSGFSRYIVIVQGFIGWVLMTVFSVTLISQLLQ